MSRTNTTPKSHKANYQVAPAGLTTETWLTPKNVVEALVAANGGELFDVDPCTPSIPKMPWPIAKRRFTLETDGLLQPGVAKPWNPKDFYFVNPPYTRGVIDQWMSKVAAQGNGLALVFVRSDVRWWHESVRGRASGLFFVRGRLSFCDVHGVPGKGKATASSVLIAYGDRALRVLEKIEKQQSVKGYLIRC